MENDSYAHRLAFCAGGENYGIPAEKKISGMPAHIMERTAGI